jgi:hypothetical protein
MDGETENWVPFDAEDFRINEVYESFDGPRLLSGTTPSGQLHLVLCVENIRSGERWLMVPVSAERLATLKSGLIPLRDGILHPEDGYVIEVRTRPASCPVQRFVSPHQIDETDLPTPNARLDVPVDAAAEPSEDITLISSRTYRNTVDLFIDTADHPQEIGATILGDLLVRVQHLIWTLAAGQRTVRGPIPNTVKRDNTFRVLAFQPGSFGVRLQSVHGSLTGDKAGADALTNLIGLLNTRDRESLRQLLVAYGPRVSARYRFMLQTLVAADAALAIRWGAPDSRRGYARLNRNDMTTTLDLINKQEDLSTETISVTGTLVAIDTRLDRFKIESFEGERYWGEISESLEGRVFEVPTTVRATIEARLVINPVTNAEGVTYRLMDIG